MLKRIVAILLLLGIAVFLLSRAGSFLIVDAPARADAMVVLGGDNDDSRLAHAVVLLKQGYANRIVLDADARFKKYGESEADRAPAFVEKTVPGVVEVCPTLGDSTYEEAADLKPCLEKIHASSVLIVTSAFHTRRALSIFSKRLPQYHWSVTSSSSPYHDADQWWKHRRWAKITLDEWEKYLWWELVEQWSLGVVLR